MLVVLSLFLTVGTRSDLTVPGCGGRLSRWGGSQLPAGDTGSRSLAPGLEIPSWCRGREGTVLLERAGFGHPNPSKRLSVLFFPHFPVEQPVSPWDGASPWDRAALVSPHRVCGLSCSSLGCLLLSSLLCFTLLVARERGRPELRLGDSCSGRLPAGWRQ